MDGQMTKKTLFVLVLLAIIFSCKKHRLSRDREALVGTWEWVYTQKFTHVYASGEYKDTIFPSDVTSSYRVEFLKNGKVRLLENGQLMNDYRIVFEKFQITGSVPGCFVNDGDVYDFEIHLNNDEGHQMNGCVSSDSLLFTERNFPFKNEESALHQVTHINIFKKLN